MSCVVIMAACIGIYGYVTDNGIVPVSTHRNASNGNKDKGVRESGVTNRNGSRNGAGDNASSNEDNNGDNEGGNANTQGPSSDANATSSNADAANGNNLSTITTVQSVCKVVFIGYFLSLDR